MNALRPLTALFDPFGATPEAVRAGRWHISLLLVCVLTAAAGVSVALKVDTSRTVIPAMMMSGELQKASEREIEDQVEQSRRVAIVGGAANGLVLMPVKIFLVALLLKVLAWLIGRRFTLANAWTTSVLAFLPLALFMLVLLVSSLRQTELSPKMAESLVPSTLAVFFNEVKPSIARLLSVASFFNVWGVLVAAAGFSQATGLKAWKSVIILLIVYALVASALLAGVPGLMEGVKKPS